MKRPCTKCGNCRAGPIGLYVCDAERLPDPGGAYLALPTRVGTAHARDFVFGQSERQRASTEIARAMSPGPVEGFIVDRITGLRRPFEYLIADCPAWRTA